MNDTQLRKKISLVARQAKNIKDRYNQMSDLLLDTDTTYFFPIRHFNSDSPAKPGNWKNIPYNIAARPLELQESGNIAIEPVLIGGGYFLWHNGTGVVIDPGYGFIYTLFYYHGITVHSINHVIVTHDHLDHHADMETILLFKQKNEEEISIHAPKSILDIYCLQARESVERSKLKVFEINKELTDNGQPFNIPNSFILITPLPTLHWQRNFGNQSANCKEMLEKHFSGFGLFIKLFFKNDLLQESEVNKESKNILITGDTLFPVKFDGEWLVYSNNLRQHNPYFNPKKARFLGWTPKKQKEENKDCELKIFIHEQAKRMINAYTERVSRCDIICLHIGSVNEVTKLDGSLKIVKSFIHEAEYCYQGFHLGFTGCLRALELLIDQHKFDSTKGLVVVTEFGEELLGHRRTICDVMSGMLKEYGISMTDLTILPSEVTMKIGLSGNEGKGVSAGSICCTYRKEPNPWKEIVALEGPGEIITYTLRDELGKAHRDCSFC